MNASPVLAKALVYGAILTIAIAVVGAVVGYLSAGWNGALSALIGAVLAATFMALTAGSIVLATRMTRNRPSSTLYFGIILWVWFLKLVLFLAVLIVLRGQHWLSPYVFFFAVIAAVIGSLITDAFALQRARVPYVGDIELPHQNRPADGSGKAP